jgi:AraC-like DNA-binding protein
MILQFQIPSPLLLSFIDHFFLMHIQLEKGQEPVLCPFPPTPLQFIVFYLDDLVITRKEGEADAVVRPRCVVVGPQATLMKLLVRESHRCFVMAFHPGGLYRLVGIPMKELYDDGFEGAVILGREMEAVTDQLQEAGSFEEMVTVAEKFLAGKLSTIKAMLPFDEAMQMLTLHNGAIPIEKIAAHACLSLRQFERTCHQRIGYSPKFYARLTRFSTAYRLKESTPSLSWTGIAHSAGYYDQMHFIRDFREFTGITPTGLEVEMKRNPFPMQKGLVL